MKKVLLLSFYVLSCAGAASGQAGDIGLFIDSPGYTDCDFTFTAAALIPVYVVHRNTPGATASQFMVQPGDGWNCTFTGEIIVVPVSIGSALSGLSASYGGCRPSPILITTINYFCLVAPPTCASLRVVPDPAAPTGTIEVVNCSFVKLEGRGRVMYANPDGRCDCWGA